METIVEHFSQAKFSRSPNSIFSFCELRLMPDLTVQDSNWRLRDMEDDFIVKPTLAQLPIEPMPHQKRRKIWIPQNTCNHKSQVPKSLGQILVPCRERPFTCFTCREVFPALVELNGHERAMEHGSTLHPSWVCHFCGAKMSIQNDMVVHLDSHHKCRRCKFFFHSPR